MKNINKISLLLIGVLTFQSITCSQNQEDVEFPTRTTEKYLYSKTVGTYIPSSLLTSIFGENSDQASINDTTSTHYFDNGITRKKITAVTENNVTTWTIETWTSKNPSHITWTNAAIVTGLIGSAVLGIQGSLLAMHIQEALADVNHPDHEYYTRIAYRTQGIKLPADYFAEKKSENFTQGIGASIKGYANGFYKGLYGSSAR